MTRIVSIRVPKTLTELLKKFAMKNHYMDVSEVVRTILRKKRMESPNYIGGNMVAELDKIKKQISKIGGRIGQ